MPPQLLRQVMVSTLLLGSFATIADVAFAEEPRPVMIPFSCTTPRVGADRCGDPDRNVRIGPEKRLTVDWVTSADKDPKTCMMFYVIHAVSGKELASKELCGAPKSGRLWTNPENKSVDVYVAVKSTNRVSHIDIGGFYIIDKP